MVTFGVEKLLKEKLTKNQDGIILFRKKKTKSAFINNTEFDL